MDDYYLTSDISKVNLKTGMVTALASTKAAETLPLFSPDGKWIAFCMDELPLSSFAKDVFVMPTDLILALLLGGSAPIEISRRGGIIDSVKLNSARSAFGFSMKKYYMTARINYN